MRTGTQCEGSGIELERQGCPPHVTTQTIYLLDSHGEHWVSAIVDVFTWGP